MNSQHPNVRSERQEARAAGRDGAMRRSRLLFVDNLRWVIIILVVSMHAADTYSPLGNWYYVDRTRLTVPELLVFAAWQMYLQSFFMGLLFFIAGYFVPSSLRRKGPGRFLRDRGFRLGVPVLFYMLLLGPVTEYFVAHSWRATHSSFAREWWRHIADLEFLSESGPLWFCLALLIFSAVYTLWRIVSPGRNNNLGEGRPPGTSALIGFAITMAALTFAVRLFQPSGTSFLNMQLGDFPQYILLFAAGVLASRKGFLLKLPFIPGIRWIALTLTVGFVSWLAILSAGGALNDNVSAYLGGWHWQSAAIDMWQSLTCVGLCVGLLVIFREKLDAQSRLTRLLSENAFAVYVFHPPVVIAAARMLQGFVWNPILKFTLVTCVSVAGTFILSEAVLRRVPVLRAIL